MLVCFTLGSLQEECLHKWIKTDHFCVGDGVAWVLECSRSASALGIMLIDEQPLHCEAEVKGLHTGMSDGELERITRSFMYIGVEGTDTEDDSPHDDSTYSEIA